jgi:hypothetical protein
MVKNEDVEEVKSENENVRRKKAKVKSGEEKPGEKKDESKDTGDAVQMELPL